MAGPYEQFKTDDDLETKGVTLNYGGFKILVARAGGANKRYARIFEAKIRPHRRAIAAGTVDPEVDRRIMAETYAESVVLGWSKVMKDKDGVEKVVDGVIEGPDGDDMPFTRLNVVKLLLDLPDLFTDIIVQAQQASVFRAEEDGVDAKN